MIVLVLAQFKSSINAHALQWRPHVTWCGNEVNGVSVLLTRRCGLVRRVDAGERVWPWHNGVHTLFLPLVVVINPHYCCVALATQRHAAR